MKKNSDNEILKELVGQKFQVKNFETEIGKIMKKRSSAKLWWPNMPDTVRDESGISHKVNYRCIPESSSCRKMFCFVLEHMDGIVLIKERYLQKI